MDRIRRCRLNWKWNLAEHVALWRQLRTNDNHHSTIARVLLGLLLVLPTISPSNLLISKEHNGEADRPATRGMDAYIAWWATALTIILLSAGRYDFANFSWWNKGLIVLAVGWRILDSLSYRGYYIFFKSRWKPWRDSRRSLGIAFGNIYEIVIGYAILFLLTNEVKDSCGKPLADGLTAAYYSFVTITTLGYGDYAPSGWPSRTLVILELLSGLTFLVVIIPSLVSLISESGKTSPSDYPAHEIDEQIRERAYELYKLHGVKDGDSTGDWLEAEAEFFGLTDASWVERCANYAELKWNKCFKRLLSTVL
jgi:hypothetical protein